MVNETMRKAMMAKLNGRGIRIEKFQLTPDELKEEESFGSYETERYEVQLSDKQILDSMNGKRNVTELIDHITGTNENDRLKAELLPSTHLGRLEKEGKAKLVNGKWERA